MMLFSQILKVAKQHFNQLACMKIFKLLLRVWIWSQWVSSSPLKQQKVVVYFKPHIVGTS